MQHFLDAIEALGILRGMSKEVVETKSKPSAAAEKPASKEPNAFGFADDLANCTLHWNEDMRELTIKSEHKIGLPFGHKIRALVAAREQSPEVIAAAPELLAMLRSLAISELTIDRDHNRTEPRLALRKEVWNLIEKAEGGIMHGFSTCRCKTCDWSTDPTPVTFSPWLDKPHCAGTEPIAVSQRLTFGSGPLRICGERKEGNSMNQLANDIADQQTFFLVASADVDEGGHRQFLAEISYSLSGGWNQLHTRDWRKAFYFTEKDKAEAMMELAWLHDPRIVTATVIFDDPKPESEEGK